MSNTQKKCIVIPYIMGPLDGIELKFALRSIHYNLVGNFNVILLGDKPSWCKNVTHIPMERIKGMMYNTFMDQCTKIKTAMELSYIGSGFIYMYDDTFFMQKIKLQEIQELKAWENMTDVKQWFKKTSASKRWCDIMKKTLNILQEKNLPIYNYETHCPRYFNVRNLKKLYAEYAPQMEPFQISTLYFNTFYKNKEPRILKPWGDNFKLGIYNHIPLNKLMKKIRTNQILNIGRSLIHDIDMRNFLEYLFPKKSKYEK